MGSQETSTDFNRLLHAKAPQISGTWIAEVFDRSLLGIVQTDPLGNVLYVNPRGNEICGHADLRSKPLRELFPDADSYGQVQRQLAARQLGLSDEYELKVRREDGRTVPISVSSMPVLSETNDPVGGISIFRSLELEKARRSFDDIISSAKNIDDLLEKIAGYTKQVVTFDMFRVSFFSRDGGHSLVVFESPTRLTPARTRWTAISEGVRGLVLNHEPSRHNLIDLLNTGQDSVKELVEEGFRASMRRPVFRLNRLMGSVAILTKNPSGFSEAEFDVFRQLPLDSVLAAALSFDAIAQLHFTVDLAKKISGCETEDEMFSLLTEELAVHHGWSHVGHLFTR